MLFCTRCLLRTQSSIPRRLGDRNGICRLTTVELTWTELVPWRLSGTSPQQTGEWAEKGDDMMMGNDGKWWEHVSIKSLSSLYQVFIKSLSSLYQVFIKSLSSLYQVPCHTMHIPEADERRDCAALGSQMCQWNITAQHASRIATDSCIFDPVTYVYLWGTMRYVIISWRSNE